MQNYRISVPGMTCDHCVEQVSTALKAAAGVREVLVDLQAKSATVRADDACPGVAALLDAIRAAGFEVAGFSKLADELAES